MRLKLLFLIALSFLFTGCSVNKLMTEANRFYSEKQYFTASEKYRLVSQKIKDKSQKAKVYFQLAQSYKQLGDYSKAAIWYKNAIRTGYKDSAVELIYADALRGAGKPEEAKLIYESELKKNPTSLQASNGLESVLKIQEWKEYQELYLIDKLNGVNSIQNDLVTQILPENNQTICISSSREEIPNKKINAATGQKFADFFISEFDSIKQKWTIPKLLTAPDFLNSHGEEISLNFDEKRTIVIFSKDICQASKPIFSQLYYSIKKDDRWKNPELVPFTIDGASYSNPMITEDGKSLLFASDQASGIGGMDIWESKILADGNFSDPVNLGTQINTPGNEIYPFQKPNGNLYFSSDFHPGIGGFDIFQAQKGNSGKWQIEQLPPPINSSGDDISIQFNRNREKGFFSSNRKGSRGIDVYSFLLPPKLFQCFGKIHDSETDSILPDVNIRIVGSDGSSQKIRSVNGKFQADLNPGNDYAIVVFANGYLNAQAKVSTRGMQQAKEFDIEIKSVPTNRPIRIDNINYESGKWDLLPQSMASLNKLVDLLKLNPEAVIEISAHTDDTGDENFNQELSEKRAGSIVKFLTEKGISDNNLKTKGYGESKPLIVSKKIAQQNEFLQVGELLNSATIEKLKNENQKEIAKSLNRRTEFKVLQASTNINSR